MSTTASTTTHALLDVLQQEGRGAQVVNGYVEEALDFLLMQIHGDYVRQPRGAHHFGQQLGDNAATLAHLALLRVRQIGYDADYGASRGCLAGIGHDQQLHNIVVGISVWINGLLLLAFRIFNVFYSSLGACLYDVYILAAHRVADLDNGLAV